VHTVLTYQMNGDTQLELMYERFPVRDKRPRRFFWCDNEIIDVFGSELRLDGIGLYSFLARRANNETGELKVSMRKISQQTGSSCGHKNAINETCKQLLLDPELVHQLFRATGWEEGSGK